MLYLWKKLTAVLGDTWIQVPDLRTVLTYCNDAGVCYEHRRQYVSKKNVATFILVGDPAQQVHLCCPRSTSANEKCYSYTPVLPTTEAELATAKELAFYEMVRISERLATVGCPVHTAGVEPTDLDRIVLDLPPEEIEQAVTDATAAE